MEWLNPTAYQWILSGHIVSIIAWMAGMLYLPRLFVYHAEAEVGSDKSETFKIMERRLLRAIVNPAMVLAWIFGILLVLTPGVVDWAMGWPWVKALLVLVLSGVHGLLSRWRRHFASDRNMHTARFYRLMNEVPTVMMIGIVIVVVAKPF
jgi:putative membrane protein